MMYIIKTQAYSNGDILVTLSNGDVVRATKDQCKVMGIAEDGNNVLGEVIMIAGIKYLAKNVDVLNAMSFAI